MKNERPKNQERERRSERRSQNQGNSWNGVFDQLNSNTPYARGFKQPLRVRTMSVWTQVTRDSVDYLLALKTKEGAPLKDSRRKTFVRGLVLAARSIEVVAKRLLMRENAPFDFFMTHRASQDHLEVFFSQVRSKSGSNNNPDCPQLRSAVKRILVRNAIRISDSSNCVDFANFNEVGFGIFELKKKKNSAPLVSDDPEMSANNGLEIDVDISEEIGSFLLSDLQIAVTGYIAGNIVRVLSGKVTCQICANALLKSRDEDHAYDAPTLAAYRLISSKQRGGLLVPSETVLKLVEACEKCFRIMVCGHSGDSISSLKNIDLLLFKAVLRYQDSARIFFDLGRHDIETWTVSDDMHSTQLQKQVCKAFLNIRLKTYGQRYYHEVVQRGKAGKRQQLNKLVLFQNL